ncbi:MAG: hypothetical protein KJ667_03630, partial [Alphaproteobacteria bacterium]|nr:hypothetical protein [Alphaproteobacteria bacterium]
MKGSRALKRWQIITVLLVYGALFLYFSGLPQKTIFKGTPGIYSYGPISGKAPRQLVVMLHSSTADGRDVLTLATALAKFLPEAVFVAPDAIFPSTRVVYYFDWFNRWPWDNKKSL